MLVLFVATAIIASFVLEAVLHYLRSNYEIEWAAAPDEGDDLVVAEIHNSLSESLRESERQMNTAFKVASGERW